MKQLALKRNTGGYTILFAVLVSSLVLAIGISILNISKKEFLIATSTRDSSAALYAADGGLECAIYSESGLLDSGVPRDTFNTATDKTANFGCNVPHSAINRSVSNSQEGTFTFAARFGNTGESCAVITVTKQKVNVSGVDRILTTMQSLGYNTGWRADPAQPGNPNIGLCDKISAKKVERGLKYSTY